MPELFDHGPEEDAFALPGDEKRLEVIRGGEPEPAPAATEPAPAAAPAEATTVEPPPAAATPEAAEPAVVEIDDARVKAYLEKYDGDVDKALAAAVEAQQVIGRQGNKLGEKDQELTELRRLVEERVGAVEETVRAAQQQQPQYDPDELVTWFEANPTQIPDVARQAFYQGNEALMDAALDAWEEIDKPAARRFERDVAVQRARQAVHAESAQAAEAAAGWNDVATKFAQEHPDLDQYAEKMREIAPRFPNMLTILNSGTPEARVEVLEFLYEKARGQATETLTTVTREIAREQAREADEAIKEATVASAATAKKAPATSVAERIAAAWDTADAPYNEGWNV